MKRTQLYNLIKNLTSAKVYTDEPLSCHVSLRIGGKADLLTIPKTAEDLKTILKLCKGIKTFVVGAGSNLIFSDSPFRGVVIKLGGGIDYIKISGTRATVGGGTSLQRLIRVLCKEGLSGLEFAVGVPATIGGAAVTNMGAYGREIGDLVRSVKVMDRAGRERVLKRKDLDFAYRKSSLQDRKLIAVEVELKLKKSHPREIRKRIKKFFEQRKEGQPLNLPSAGSVFKNPKGDYAGRLIEEAHCKGMRVGDAQVSAKHANFIVNLGEASAADFLTLMHKVSNLVEATHGIKLEPEVTIIKKN